MTKQSKKLLLISNSFSFSKGFLGHVEEVLIKFLSTKNVLFIPYALKDWDGSTLKIQSKFSELGIKLESIHTAKNAIIAVKNAQAICVGGGNTFRLLKTLQDMDLINSVRDEVLQGKYYIGSSAGVNVACPTIMTTNDMPIIEPLNLKALGLVDFQINPHYMDPDPTSRHMGETREERIIEFLEENEVPVVGLREDTWLLVKGSEITVGGGKQARIFEKGLEPREVSSGERIYFKVK